MSPLVTFFIIYPNDIKGVKFSENLELMFPRRQGRDL